MKVTPEPLALVRKYVIGTLSNPQVKYGTRLVESNTT